MTQSDVKLPRLRAMIAITSGDKATTAFANFWDQFASAIESSLNGVIDAQTAAAAAQTAADTAQTAATAAMGAASTAQTAVDAINDGTLISQSYVTGCSITGHDDGLSCTISISANTRVYGDGSSVAVSSGSISGLPYSSDCWIYYDDPTRAGGAVTYHQTGNSPDAFPSAANPNRHFVGAITTPASGFPDTTGNPADHPGYVGP